MTKTDKFYLTRLSESDLEAIYLRLKCHEYLSPRLFDEIAGCVVTAVIEKNSMQTNITNRLIEVLQDISATGYSNIDRDKARAALAATQVRGGCIKHLCM